MTRTLTSPTTDSTTVAELGRRTQDHLELVHAVIFSAPETVAELGALGLDDHATRYFAQRAAAMGAVGPRLVSATFLGFSPELVARAIPTFAPRSAQVRRDG